MASTYTSNNGIEKPGSGEQAGLWDETTNTNFDLIDTSLDGQVTITLASTGSSGSPNALTISNGADSNGRNRYVEFNDGGDLGGTAFVQLSPSDAKKVIYVRNSLSGSQSINIFQGTYNASNDYTLEAGKDVVLKFDGGGASATVEAVLQDMSIPAITTPSATITGGTLSGVSVSGATITGGSITGMTDITVADGGTGASTAAGARTNLGLENAINAIGVTVTSGTSSAYTVSAPETLTSLVSGQEITLRFHAATTAGATLNVDGLGAVELRYYQIGTGTPQQIIGGSVQTNGMATLVYDGTYWIVKSGITGTTNVAGSVRVLNEDDMATGSVSWPPTQSSVKQYVQDICHPVGGLYFSTTDTDPATTLGFGTWSAYAAGEAIVGVGTSGTSDAYAWTAGQQRGLETHTLTINEIPAHSHTISDSSNMSSGGVYNISAGAAGNNGANTGNRGGGASHNNIQPSIAVYVWVRDS